MAKIKISQKQYDTILLREHESRLQASSDILNENLNPSAELLNEGWREVVLGVAMMLGVGLTGQNKAIAQNAVKNDSTMAQIKATLEDEEKIGELVDALKEKGMKDPEGKLAQNAEKVEDAFNRIAADNNIKYKVDVKAVSNLQGLKSKLSGGYALKNLDVSTDTVQTPSANTPLSVTVIDTIEIDLGTDNLFVTGGYTLSQAGIDVITIALDSIKKEGGKVQSVDIESSTDAERIAKFITKNDPTGNIQLAHLRTQSVANLINGIDSVNITHREIPNNGAYEISTQDFIKAAKDPQAIKALREKSSQYRYIKVKIVATFESTPENVAPNTETYIKHYRAELVKVTESAGTERNIKVKTHFKQKKFKCAKKKVGEKIVDACTTF